MKKKILALLLVTIMLVALMPKTALALTTHDIPDGFTINLSDNSMYYMGEELPYEFNFFSGDILNVKAGPLGVTIIGDPGIQLYITCEEGVTLTIEDLMINDSGRDDACALAFTGSDNTLILKGTNVLKSGKFEPGVRVEAGTSLEIKDDGETGADSLTVTGGPGAAGIGGGSGSGCGNITISGTAKVTASGSDYQVYHEEEGYYTLYGGGAGIGSGDGGEGDPVDAGNAAITIKDNTTVTATGASYAAGIGGGDRYSGGSITISGHAQVTATGGAAAAGIGGGRLGNGGTILITDYANIIDAVGGPCGAGIGGGTKCSGEGTITISENATVKAYGGSYSAGVGTADISDGCRILIKGSAEVIARNDGYGAGIGSGSQCKSPGTITISENAKVDAHGSAYSAGIGGGYESSAGEIFIKDSAEVDAVGGSRAAGIGGGWYGGGGTINISDGIVYAARHEEGSYDIGPGKNASSDTIIISGRAAVFLRTNAISPQPTTTTHRHVTLTEDTEEVAGFPVPGEWTPPFGAYLYACYLTYNANGGIDEPAQVLVEQGENVTVASDTGMSFTGYDFVRWDTQSAGDGISYDPGDIILLDVDKTLYAIWNLIEVEDVDITSDTEVLLPDDVKTLTAVVTPDTALDKSLSWTSSDESVATVDSQGAVTAISMGTATIKAETSNGCFDTCQIVVSGVLMNYELSTGSVMKMSATVLPSGTTAVWTSDNESVATVAQDGTVTAKETGYAVITATGGSMLHKCGVVVYDQMVTSVALSRTSADLTVGDSFGLTAYVDPDDAVNKDVAWTSDDEDVAKVNDSGTVTAVGAGSTTITAKSGGQSASCTIEVTLPVTIATLDLPAGTLGESYSRTVAAGGGKGSYTWYASGFPDGFRMERDTGKISGKPGETGDFSVKVTVYDSEGRSAEKTFTLTVSPPSAAGKYEIVPDNDSAYTVSTEDGFTVLKVNSGVTGFRYFKVSINPIVAHEGEETCVFVHMRKGVQVGFFATVADFDNPVKATAGFNVKPGDIIRVYIVDELSNSTGSNPVLLQ